jgi:hypothetical protein
MGGRKGIAGVVVAALVCVGAAGCSGDDDGGSATTKDKGSSSHEESKAERAPEGVVQVLMPADVEAELDPIEGAVGTETVRVNVVGSGEVDEIGRGRGARQPAKGERFVVAQIEKQPLDLSQAAITYREQTELAQRGVTTFSVGVGNGVPVDVNLDAPSYSPLPIDLDQPPVPPAVDPNALAERLVVVSVPEDIPAVELIVKTPEYEQTISLVTGEPGPRNLPLLARENRSLLGPIEPQDISYTRDEFGMGGSATEPIGVASATLQWSTGTVESRRTAENGRALLQVAVDKLGINLILATELRLPDGTVLQPLAPDSDIAAEFDPAVVFDVPADFTNGTFVLGKDYTWEVPTGGTISMRFDHPVEFAIDIPANKPA